MEMLKTLKDVRDENRNMKEQNERLGKDIGEQKVKIDEVGNDSEDLRLEKMLLKKKCNKEMQELELKLEQDKYIMKTLNSNT